MPHSKYESGGWKDKENQPTQQQNCGALFLGPSDNGPSVISRYDQSFQGWSPGPGVAARSEGDVIVQTEAMAFLGNKHLGFMPWLLHKTQPAIKAL